ncbi:MAG TPA: hypothetical protein VK468_09480, partial [Pyrinomonadaceae bacterium]|nr:hypothetical protein [Pyrinomonadaceae bacterium]
DMFDALAFFGWYAGLGIQRVFQGVAAGLVGPDAARAGGWNTWMLGLFLHFVTAFCVAAVYYFVSSKLRFMIDRPVISGIVFGVAVHFVMQCIVIPLSAIHQMPTFPLRSTLNGVIGHALLVGLPVALIASWSARRSRKPPETRKA